VNHVSLLITNRFSNRCGCDEYGFSEELSFYAAPAIGNNLDIFAYGDLGNYSGPGTNYTIRTLEETLQPRSLILHLGDISCRSIDEGRRCISCPHFFVYNLDAMGRGFVWDEFFMMIEKVASQVPYMVGIGKLLSGPPFLECIVVDYMWFSR
jgi:hypothetical protein